MKLKICVLLMSILIGSSLGNAHETKFAVDDLGWLRGCWAMSKGNREVNEHWMAPSGQTMLGMSRTVAGGKTVEFEFIQIRMDEKGDIYYVARPSGQTETSFKLVKLEGQHAIFENLAHDFPQRIIYRLERDGSLFARIEGLNNGKEMGVSFPMKRAKCE